MYDNPFVDVKVSAQSTSCAPCLHTPTPGTCVKWYRGDFYCANSGCEAALQAKFGCQEQSGEHIDDWHGIVNLILVYIPRNCLLIEDLVYVCAYMLVVMRWLLGDLLKFGGGISWQQPNVVSVLSNQFTTNRLEI